MKSAKDLLIEKQNELIEYSKGFVQYIPYVKDLLTEIASLEEQIEKEIKDYPIFDKEYLNECIEKATPNLSKIKNVDKCLDEIRGIEKEPKPLKRCALDIIKEDLSTDFCNGSERAIISIYKIEEWMQIYASQY